MQYRKINMALKITTTLTKIFLFFLNHFKSPKIKISATQSKHQDFHLLSQKQDLENHILIFDVEKALLKSPSLFPYFMLVAFEAGSPLRSLTLLLLYPLISLLYEDLAIAAMVMVCFLGLERERFTQGRSVLPKFFLEDVGMESFEIFRRAKNTVAVSSLPAVMVESFLRDYLDADFVVARDIRVFHGYFLGIMQERRDWILVDEELRVNAIGVGSSNGMLFSSCKDVYMVGDQERENWHQLPKKLYPKPLILHDGRLAFCPTFLATLAMFIWLPLGFTLAISRVVICITFPPKIALLFLRITGIQIRVSKSKGFHDSISKRKLRDKGVLYVCNHKSLFDPIVIYYSLGTPLTAVTYGLSRMSEALSIINTVRLSRKRDWDSAMMSKSLSRGDLVVCPEGTTCREAYLLRFSPLFTEISDEIFPVALDCCVGMFYGTTAGGFKALDPLFFLMNPRATYTVRFLDVVCRDEDEDEDEDDENSDIRVANFVQNEIAKALGFTCTNLTRKDKYLILAGNDGVYC